ncbi:MAG: hypothetical protein WEB30_00210 [Cyclobacteriaceae bacterium]
MDNQKDPLLSREDDLRAENNLLKLKLTLEYGMQMEETSKLSPGVENQWLKSVYAFERQFKDAKRIKVYDYIGRPAFKKWDTLAPGEIAKELNGIQTIMAESEVELGCICEYDDATIYRFITEELFGHEMDDMRIPGMTCHFTYEEFHPNHDYDVRQHTSDFVRAIFTRPWNEEFHDIALARRIVFSGKGYDRPGISSIIKVFQEAHASLRIKAFDIREVVIDAETAKADVHGSLSLTGKITGGDKIGYEGMFSFHFVRDDDYWYIGEFDIPGLRKRE